jgi:hypothetical protein
MGANVFANGMEVSGKASAHQVIASMPDVCLSPPSPPAGPVPIPYPNFAQASDTTDGSKTVLAGGKEINLKGQSMYKKSTGDEAATKSLGMGVVSHNITGPVKHTAGSFDVKVEGAQVVRHMDLTSGNHSNPTNACMTPDAAGLKPADRSTSCSELQGQNEAAQREKHPRKKKVADRETIVAAHYTPPNGGGWSINSSSHMAGFTKKKGWAHGFKTRKGNYKTTKICKEAMEEFEYAGNHPNQGPMGHAESRILESVFAGFGSNPGGTLTLRIQQKFPRRKKLGSRPCKKHCKKLVCAAEKCGISIQLCVGDPGRIKKQKC